MNNRERFRPVLWNLSLPGSIGFLAMVALILAMSFNRDEGYRGSSPLAPYLRALASPQNVEAGPVLRFDTDEEYSDLRVRRLEYSGLGYFPADLVLIPEDGTARLVAAKIRAANRSAPRWSRFGRSNRFFLRYEVEGATVELVFSTGAGGFTIHRSKEERHRFYAGDELTKELGLMLGF